MGKVHTTGPCPKCGGKLYLDRDYNGWYEQCLQCGHIKDLAIVYQNKIKKIADSVLVKKAAVVRKKVNHRTR
jgi:hypothetical protein